MSAFWGNAIGVMIVIIMLVFIGIWIWAWRSRHKVTFDRLSALPMEDSPESEQEHSNKKAEQPLHDDKGSCS